MSEFIRVASVDEVPEGTAKLVHVHDRAIAVVHSQGRFFAFNNVCRHKGGPLCEGEINGTKITCPWHAWEYDMDSGECEYDANVILERFEVRISGTDIEIAV